MTLEDFLVFEKANDCEKFHIDNFHYWWYVRKELILQCGCIKRAVEKSAGKNGKKASVNSRIVFWVRAIATGLKASPFRKGKKNSLFVLQDATVYNPEEGYYECPPTQSVVKNWNGEMTLLSDYYTNYSRNAFPVQFPETTFIIWPLLAAKVKRRLWRMSGKERKKKEKIKESVSPVLNLLETQYSCSLDLGECIDWIYHAYLQWEAHYRYYERLIVRLKPIGAAEQCWYSTWKMVFQEVAKKYQVPVIELQHGTISGHLFYNSYLMRSRAYPDYVLLFSNYWKDYANIPLPDERIFSVGYPYLEERVLKSKKMKENKEGKNRLLLVIGGADLADRELRKYLCEVCAYIREHHISNYKIMYKMHPRFTDFYEEICNMFEEYKDIVQVLRRNEKNLYDCFAIADEQISVFSTGLYEGIAYGLTTWVYQSEDYKSDALENLCHKGYAFYVKRPEQLFEERTGKMLRAETKLWEDHSKEKLVDAINCILRKEGRI